MSKLPFHVVRHFNHEWDRYLYDLLGKISESDNGDNLEMAKYRKICYLSQHLSQDLTTRRQQTSNTLKERNTNLVNLAK